MLSQRKDWVSTTAIITEVDSLSGTVSGMFTDINGVTHSNVEIYANRTYQGDEHFEDRKLIMRKEIKIVYNPITYYSTPYGSSFDEIDRSRIDFYCFSVISLLISIILLSVCKKNLNLYDKNCGS
ncbi:MAG: hypothetical protein HDT22_07795 [Ruminococcus sp.]|nr:hypothetical protein [Ruminococcus sp.]